MKFLTVTVPRSNEYTYEQSLALFSSLGTASKKSILKKVFAEKKANYHSFNILSTKQRIYFVVATQDNLYEHVYNQILAQYPEAQTVTSNPVIYNTPYYKQLKLSKKDH